MRLLLSACFIAITCNLNAQSLRPGVSLTYLRDNAVPDRNVQHHEYSLNANLVYELTPRNNIGLQYIFIRTKGSAYKYSEEIIDYYIAGIFYQYDILQKSAHEFFPEVSLNYGSYCPCGNLDPYNKGDLVYFGYGMGMDLQVYKNLYLDLGLHYYRPILKAPTESNIWAFGQYILGFSYKLN